MFFNVIFFNEFQIIIIKQFIFDLIKRDIFYAFYTLDIVYFMADLNLDKKW